ncbi:protein kinase [candidate division KSB1 bacterium]|nr:protein kinase [candidate division KSB1 bacterium]
MIGQTISHYKILEKLGGGGMGVVYKAQDLKLDRFVALKFLPPHLSADEDEKKRFIHEAKAASALDHPNICAIYEIDETEDGQMFIAMAYYEGETLKKKIERGPLPIDQTIDLAIQIAQGLAKAHKHGITHRDIKPANVMITKEGVAKIVDFGLAKLAGQTKLTKSGMTVGTVAYMSPEQARGEEVDHRTDIWALGVVLYEMITGQLPFKGEYEQAVIYSILCQEPASIISLRTGVPMELERVVNKAMAKKAGERYQHMDEMLTDLRLLKKEAEAGVSKERLTKPKLHKSKRSSLYIGATGLLVLLFGIGLHLWLNTEEKKEAVSPDKYRIAVLPLANISPDPQDEYFVDGMTEELISTLLRIDGLRVIARTSVMRYKVGGNKDVAEIGRELKVGTVLEGSVRKSANKLRITAQLIDVQTQEHLWSRNYDRVLQDVFAIQSDIAQQVAEALKVRLLTGEKGEIEKKATENLEAYTLYLKGRYFWNKRTEADINKAILHFEQAIKIDSTYALAYSGLADSYSLLANRGSLSSKEACPRAKAAAIKAVEIDDTLAEAHTSLGFVRMAYDWDWLVAEKEFKRAIDLNPSYAIAHQMYARYLSGMGRHDEAIAEIKRAEELDPLSLPISAGVGQTFLKARRYDQAIEQLRKTQEMDPNFAQAHYFLGGAYLNKEMNEQAIAELQKAITLSADSLSVGAALVQAYAKLGKRNEAQKRLDEVIELSKNSRHAQS